MNKGLESLEIFTSRAEQIYLNSICFRVPGSMERAKIIKRLHPEWYLSLSLWQAVTLGNLLHPADLCFSHQYNDPQFLTVSYSGMLKVALVLDPKSSHLPASPPRTPPTPPPALAPELWLLKYKCKQLSQIGNMIVATLMAKQLGAKNPWHWHWSKGYNNLFAAWIEAKGIDQNWSSYWPVHRLTSLKTGSTQEAKKRKQGPWNLPLLTSCVPSQGGRQSPSVPWNILSSYFSESFCREKCDDVTVFWLFFLRFGSTFTKVSTVAVFTSWWLLVHRGTPMIRCRALTMETLFEGSLWLEERLEANGHGSREVFFLRAAK